MDALTEKMGKLILKATSPSQQDQLLVPFSREDCRMCISAEGKPQFEAVGGKWAALRTNMYAKFIAARSNLGYSGDTELTGITAENENVRKTDPLKAKHTLSLLYYPHANLDLAKAEVVFSVLLDNYEYGNKSGVHSHNLAVSSAYLAICLESMFLATADFITASAKEGKNKEHVKLYDDALKDTKKEMPGKGGFNSLSPEDQEEAVKQRIAKQVQDNSATSHTKSRKYLTDFCTPEMKAKIPSYFAKLGEEDEGDTIELYTLNASRNVFAPAKGGKPGITSAALKEKWDGKIPSLTLDAFAKTVEENEVCLNPVPLIVNGKDRVIDIADTATGYSRFCAVVARGGTVSTSIEFLAALKVQLGVYLGQKIVVYAKKPPSSKHGTKRDHEDCAVVVPMTSEECAEAGYDSD